MAFAAMRKDRMTDLRHTVRAGWAPSPVRFAGALGLAACFLLLAAPARSQDDPVVARVDGTEIHASDVAIAEEEIGSGMQPMPPEAKREYLITYLTDTLLVAKAAEKAKLDQGAEFQRRLAFTRNRLLSEAMLAKQSKAGVTDAAMHKVYDEALAKMGKQQEVHARHILVPTEEEAKAIEAELKKGADFATLAKEKSKDPGAAEGGDLGYFTKDQMVPEFAEVAFKLEPGKISDPVKTQFGWHIIKVEDKRDKPVPTFDKVKDQIERFLERKAQTEMVAKLRADAKIEHVEAKPAAAPAAGAPAPAGAAPKK
jgi:peptidyl-prolyl cis-trans isomerase C